MHYAPDISPEDKQGMVLSFLLTWETQMHCSLLGWFSLVICPQISVDKVPTVVASPAISSSVPRKLNIRGNPKIIVELKNLKSMCLMEECILIHVNFV
jgi:hypothetical protein